MPGYRLFILDKLMKIVGVHEAECDTDYLAMQEAYVLARTCHAVEVWSGPRMVARVPHQPTTRFPFRTGKHQEWVAAMSDHPAISPDSRP